MTSVTEAMRGALPLQGALDAGLQSLDRGQAVLFQQYQRFVMPLDGTVFWVATGGQQSFDGSLHYGTDRHQDEDQTIGINRVVFTSETEITLFNDVAPGTMWIGTAASGVADTPLQIAFSRRADLYFQAELWHYIGDAVYPAMAAQLVQSVAALAALAPIVSNSLPIWLTQTAYAPVYPSYLVPDNLAPPYVVAHVEPDGTEALQAFPHYVWPGTIEPNSGASPLHDLPSYQLVRDRVRLTLYGFNNQRAIQFLGSLIEYSLNTDDFGFMNMPVIRDDKRYQTEIAALAQKKTIEIVASYYQSTAAAIARRLILSAAVTTTVAPFQAAA